MPLILTVKAYGNLQIQTNISTPVLISAFEKLIHYPKELSVQHTPIFLLCYGFVRIKIQPVIKSRIDFSKQVYCNTWSIFLNKRSLFDLTKQAMLTQYETHLKQDFISCLFLSTEDWNKWKWGKAQQWILALENWWYWPMTA